MVHEYLRKLCREAHAAGLPRTLVYTHQGGTYAPWDKNMPWWPAINEFATPGWSFYGVDPRNAGGLDAALDDVRGRWAAVEWWWGAPGAQGWQDHLTRTLGFRDCRMVVIYNWNCGFRFREAPGALEGLRNLVATWEEG